MQGVATLYQILSKSFGKTASPSSNVISLISAWNLQKWASLSLLTRIPNMSKRLHNGICYTLSFTIGRTVALRTYMYKYTINQLANKAASFTFQYIHSTNMHWRVDTGSTNVAMSLLTTPYRCLETNWIQPHWSPQQVAEAYPGLDVIAYMPGFLTPDQEPAEDERCKCLMC